MVYVDDDDEVPLTGAVGDPEGEEEPGEEDDDDVVTGPMDVELVEVVINVELVTELVTMTVDVLPVDVVPLKLYTGILVDEDVLPPVGPTGIVEFSE